MKNPYPPAESFGQPLSLSIYPAPTDKSLRPWDGADEYLLEQIKEDDTSLLIVNDRYGALTLPLADKTGKIVCDSFSSRRAIEHNLEDNGIKPTAAFLSSLDDLPESSEEAPGLILMKIPKSLALFSWQLDRLRMGLKKDTPILAAGMSKHLPPAFYEAFESRTGEPSYSLIKKKARYYQGKLTPLETSSESPEEEFRFSHNKMGIVTLPGVFSQGKIDRGTLFLLEHFPRAEAPSLIIDPGSGCGVLAVKAALTWPEAKIIATDDSALAVESTRRSAALNGVEERVDCRQTHILEGVEDGSADLIICNPPFHSEHRMNLESGFAFIEDCARVLKAGGQLFMVANRYLGYEKKLKELFEGTMIIGQNKKYRVHMCRK